MKSSRFTRPPILLVLLTLVAALIGVESASGQAVWTEDFDGYAAGSTIGGQGPWQTWDLSTAADASVTDAFSRSAPNSLNVSGAADIVREFDGLNGGIYTVSAWVYVPSTQTGELYFIMLNTYDPGGPYNWSVQLQMNAALGVISDQGGSAGGPGTGTTLPLVVDDWAEISVEIDFDANLHRIFYNADLLRDWEIWSAPTAQSALEAIDLFSNDSSDAYYDDLALTPDTPCGSCCPFDTLTCTSDCSTGQISLSWSSFSAAPGYASGITVERDGTVIATLAGDATSFDDPAVLAAGTYTYTVTGDCGTGTTWSVSCSVLNAAYGGETDVVVNLDLGGRHDAGQVIADTLTSIGRTVAFGDLMDPCFPDPASFDFTVWVTLGTYPNNTQLSGPMGDKLVELNTAGVPIYISGGDAWGFDPDTAFRDYDGVDQSTVEDGDDSCDDLVGQDTGVGLDLTPFSAHYYQDTDDYEWTDRIEAATTTPDLGGDQAGNMWESYDPAGTLTGFYNTGVYYNSTFGPVICQTWEFAGFTGDKEALLTHYIEALGGPAAPCTPPSGLTAATDCATGDVTLTWTVSDTYTTIDILRDDVEIATGLPGTDTSYVDAAVASGEYTYAVRGNCAAGSAYSNLEYTHSPSLGQDHVVYIAERPQGIIDSGTALVAALEANGESVMVVDSLTDPCFPSGAYSTLWIVLGTFPSNTALTQDEAQIIVDEHEMFGVNVYLEGSDHWGTDAPTLWDSYDGVNNGLDEDGDDTFIGMIGNDSGVGLDLSGFDAAYNQDMSASDYTDRITPVDATTADLGGDLAGAIWADDGTGGAGAPYNTGVYYDSDFGNVLSITWEFGGYDGDQTALMAQYLTVMAPVVLDDQFRRGDANGDGGMDISDAIFTLSSLFVPGSPAPPCAKAADANDDGGNDISDAIYTLSGLFVPGSPPPPAPYPDCGSDPTPDSLTCETISCP